jgi:hypothetical protein
VTDGTSTRASRITTTRRTEPMIRARRWRANASGPIAAM